MILRAELLGNAEMNELSDSLIENRQATSEIDRLHYKGLFKKF